MIILDGTKISLWLNFILFTLVTFAIVMMVAIRLAPLVNLNLSVNIITGVCIVYFFC